MNDERLKCRDVMVQINELLISKNIKEIDQIILSLNPEKDSLRMFISVIRCCFSFKNNLKNWEVKVEEFYIFHENKNTENFKGWFIGLKK